MVYPTHLEFQVESRKETVGFAVATYAAIARWKRNDFPENWPKLMRRVKFLIICYVFVVNHEVSSTL